MKNNMYDRLKKLYEQGRIDKDGLWNAVEKGWITVEEYHEIVGE